MKVVFVMGPTASGKSDYALWRAQQDFLSSASVINSAIVNCDSIQVYNGLEIGSCLPSKEAMAQIPHYLYAFIPEGGKITAGLYAREFFALLEKIKSIYKQIFVVGGTGFYFQAIEKGLFNAKGEDPQLRADLQGRLKTPEGAQALYEEFRLKDPEAAKKISFNDHYRLVRAMELMIASGKTISQLRLDQKQQPQKFPWALEKIGLKIEKDYLLPIVQRRTQKMLAKGFVDEVRQLRERGLRRWAPMESVGYREVNIYLDGSLEIPDLRTLEEKIVQGTMKLAKKQKTWFQRDSEIQWISHKPNKEF